MTLPDTHEDTVKLMLVTVPRGFCVDDVLQKAKQLCQNWDGPEHEYDTDVYHFYLDDAVAAEQVAASMDDWQFHFPDIQYDIH